MTGPINTRPLTPEELDEAMKGYPRPMAGPMKRPASTAAFLIGLVCGALAAFFAGVLA